LKSTWKTLVAGILDIVAGCFKLMGVLGLIIAIIAIESENRAYVHEVNPVYILTAIAVPLAILGILAIVGGIYTINRKNWALAIIGSIAAFLPFSLLGLIALILTAFARDEFRSNTVQAEGIRDTAN